MNKPLSWDIYCRVVDNFGDVGVCWRLARQLAAEFCGTVRLWVDDLARWHALCPAGDAALDVQHADGVEVRRWTSDLAAVVPADVAIDAFGCGLPDDYAAALAARRPRALWITLEYLSAESWVPAHHGLPSPHPRLAVDRYFYFPGFVQGTGGLLRERGLLERRDRFDAAARAAFWRQAGFEPPSPAAQVVSLFGYPGAPAVALMRAWEADAVSRVVAIPDGPLAAAVGAWLGEPAFPGRSCRRGALDVRVLPFVAQPVYDELLWSADVNFVRGEDSFVRAQWAGRPCVWHIYPQQEGAHRKKLAAFLDLYCTGLAPDAARSVRALWSAWNGSAEPGSGAGDAWQDFYAHRDEISAHAGNWARGLALQPDLARQLAQFCTDRLK